MQIRGDALCVFVGGEEKLDLGEAASDRRSDKGRRQSTMKNRYAQSQMEV